MSLGEFDDDASDDDDLRRTNTIRVVFDVFPFAAFEGDSFGQNTFHPDVDGWTFARITKHPILCNLDIELTFRDGRVPLVVSTSDGRSLRVSGRGKWRNHRILFDDDLVYLPVDNEGRLTAWLHSRPYGHDRLACETCGDIHSDLRRRDAVLTHQ